MGNDRAEREKRKTPSPAKQPAKQATSSNYTRINWTSVTLTPAQKNTLREAPFDTVRFIDTLAHMVENGYKIVINPRNDRGFVGVSIIGLSDECPDQGYGLSGEGGSFDRACQSLAFKLELLDYSIRTDSGDVDDDFR